MTIRGRHRLAASVLLAALGTACGGGGGEHSTAHLRAPETSTTVAPRPEPTMPSHHAAGPKIIDRGSDFAAIAGSELEYGRWLEAHHPDPALIALAYEPGSAPAKAVLHDITTLRASGARLVEVDRAPFDFEVISARANVVSLRLTEHLAHRDVIARNGRVIARDAPRTEHYMVSIMRPFPDHPWRVNLVEWAHPRIEVQL